MATYQILCLALVGVFATRVAGYQSGAPNSPEICEKLTPKHGVDPQTTASPYKLSLDKTQVKPGQEVKLTISGNDAIFKGFLVQGRKIGADGPVGPVGKFVAVKNTGDSQPLNCADIVGSSITHTNNNEKKTITLTWVAPEQKGSYQLL